MRRLLAVAALLVAASLSAAAQTENRAQKHPVEEFFMAGIAAFNAHDLEGFMKQFAGDIEMYTPTGWLRGREGVRERFAQTFRQFPSVRMEIEELRVREVARGMAVTDFRWRVYPMGKGPAFHGVGSGVYVLRDGRWAEVLEHETVVKVDEGLIPAKR
ncbi:MAG TPA: nuclear transport factor 2 family protein [Pyrinomonadaceae bacterium]|nr:nuclear transport factor 2 family protein [Pyrinomonadaceae bacterium]